MVISSERVERVYRKFTLYEGEAWEIGSRGIFEGEGGWRYPGKVGR